MSPASRTRAKVLVVEDDDGLREGLRDLFEDKVDVDDASTVSAALEAMASSRYSVVLTDLSIDGSGLGGEEVIQRARAQLCPVVVLSGSTELDAKVPDPRSRPDAYLTKPFRLEAVEGLVEGYLGLERATAELGSGPRPPEPGGVGPRSASWLQIPAAGSVTLPPGGVLGLRVLEGRVQVGGGTWGAGSYCFLSGMAPAQVEGLEPSLVVTVRHLP